MLPSGSGVVGATKTTVPYPRGRAVPTRGRRRLLRPRSSAKKSPEQERGGGDALSGVLPGRSLLLRAGAALFALGFVDAGYVNRFENPLPCCPVLL